MPVPGRPLRVPVPSELSCAHICTSQRLQAPFYPRSAVPQQEHSAIPASPKTNAQSSLPHDSKCHGHSAAAPSHSRPHTLTACSAHIWCDLPCTPQPCSTPPPRHRRARHVCGACKRHFSGVSMCVAKWVQAPTSLPAAVVVQVHVL